MKLRILFIEDSKIDTEIELRLIRQSGYDVVAERVETKAAMQAALASQEWDVIIADYSLPQFGGMGALETLKESGLDLPFIIVSGTIGEETAVALMRSGAHDYVLKHNISRLIPAIERELQEAANRRARREAVQELKNNQERLIFLSEASRLLGSSLDYEATLKDAMTLTIPQFADFSAIDLAVGDGQYLRLVVAPNDLEHTRHIQEIRRHEKVILTGKAELNVEVSDSVLEKSSICAPLIARDQILGAVTFVITDSDRQYGEKTLWLAQEFARRAAAAVDNAKLYREAQIAINARDEFLSIASHELNTPLTSLLLQLQITKRELDRGQNLPGRERLTEVLDISLNQANRIAKLVEELLDATRIRAGHLILNFEMVNLSEFVREVAAKFSVHLSQVGCELQYKITPEVTGWWDKSRIEQVLSNLLSNVIKYAPGKPVIMTVLGNEKTATLKVQDFGTGISKDKQAKLFHRFERMVGPENISGLGLGLYITDQIVRALKGQISIESEEGKGSTFIIELPRSQ
ncbi:MAG: response regulator [Bdellovibrio sp.]|nr:response regulator [Bdellovibrio sp.]